MVTGLVVPLVGVPLVVPYVFDHAEFKPDQTGWRP
jgi:hypothetical protein